ncbi:MAG: ABC transporter ATP-binding protein [Candidatus Omnitrophica bacterium]|jgi:ABC-type lipoprotein export system ATPase subunit|nr:ABC transporter ATP-binding protein [Candidatus Omnitrophota bacterium]
MKNCMIKTNKLTKVYKLLAEEIYAVHDVDLEVAEGDFVAIMGPSGSGKTTLLDSLGCLTTITSGSLNILGKDVSKAKENTLVSMRRQSLGFVFQDFLLIPTLTAIENVQLPLLFARLPREARQAKELLESVGLGKRMNHLPKELSGGEKQRVAIARALITSPKILFADEPTGNLDTKNSNDIFSLLADLNKKENLTIILTTHNPKLGSQAARVIYLKDGRIVSREDSSLCV